jgi:hypothetical protein
LLSATETEVVLIFYASTSTEISLGARPVGAGDRIDCDGRRFCAEEGDKKAAC